MLKTVFPITVLLVAATFAHAGIASVSWQTAYGYKDFGGYDGGGTSSNGNPIIIDYNLYLGDPSTSECRLTVQGFQTNEDIICTAIGDAKQLDIRFKSYGDGGTTNIYGIKVYLVGESLFTLIQKGSEVVTEWHQMKQTEKSASGIYFKPLNYTAN